MLRDCQVIKQTRFVGEKGQPPFGLDGLARQVEPANLHGAARRRDDAGQTAQGRRFARAIGADQADDFPGAHRKGQIVHRREVAV
jgi:hypothetical protein